MKYLISEHMLSVGGTKVDAYSLTLGTGVYSDGILNFYNTGHAGLLFESLSGTDDVDISFQVSQDNIKWWDPVDTNGTSLGSIYTAAGSDLYIAFSPLAAKYIRFFLDPDANSIVTVRYLFQELV